MKFLIKNLPYAFSFAYMFIQPLMNLQVQRNVIQLSAGGILTLSNQVNRS